MTNLMEIICKSYQKELTILNPPQKNKPRLMFLRLICSKILFVFLVVSGTKTL